MLWACVSIKYGLSDKIIAYTWVGFTFIQFVYTTASYVISNVFNKNSNDILYKGWLIARGYYVNKHTLIFFINH